MQLSRTQQIGVGVIAVLCIVAGVFYVAGSLRGPEPVSMSQIQEPPLPNNVTDAWAEVETRRMGDMLSGMDQQTVEARHAKRLAQFETIRAGGQGGDKGG